MHHCAHVEARTTFMSWWSPSTLGSRDQIKIVSQALESVEPSHQLHHSRLKKEKQK